MTEKECQKIRSAYCNGFEYPFGGGCVENCDMDEVNRHAELLDAAIKKQIPQKPVPAKKQHERYALCYECPSCHGNFAGTGIANYCYHCGQALDWEMEDGTNEKAEMDP